MSNQGGIQAAIRAQTGLALDYNGDWHALFDADSIAAGTYNERLLSWINFQLSASYTDLPAAMQAFAVNQSFDSWNSMNTIVLPAFTPAILFPTAWYDPSDLTTLWQDVAGTVPVVADNDPVARMDDKSGNGRHFTQGTGASQPLYKTSGGLHWLQFDGTDDQMDSTATLGQLISASAYEMAIAGNFAAVDTDAANVWQNDAFFGDATSEFSTFAYARSTGVIGGYNWDGNADTVTAAYTITQDFLWAQRHEAGLLYGALNGDADSSVASGDTTTLSGTMTLGRSGNEAAFVNGRFYGAVFKNSVLYPARRAALKTWLGAKAGLVI